VKLAYGMQGCVYVFNSFVHFQGGGKVITMVFEAIGKYHFSLSLCCYFL
jgi:hypothetical protein